MKKIIALFFCASQILAFNAFAAGKVNYLNVDEDVVYFSTNVAKTASSPACMAAENSERWTISLNTKNGRAMYSLLATALAGTLDIEVISGQDCSVVDGFERARSVAVMPDLSAATGIDIGTETPVAGLYLYSGDGLTKLGPIMQSSGANIFYYYTPDSENLLVKYWYQYTTNTVYFDELDCTGGTYMKTDQSSYFHLNLKRYINVEDTKKVVPGAMSYLLHSGECENRSQASTDSLYAVNSTTYRHPQCGEGPCILKDK